MTLLSLSLSLSLITYKKVSLWGKAFWTIWINKRDILCFVSLSTESNPYFLPTIIRARTQDHHALPCVMMPPASIWAQFASKIRVFPLFFHDMNHTHMLCKFKLLQQLCCAHAPLIWCLDRKGIELPVCWLDNILCKLSHDLMHITWKQF